MEPTTSKRLSTICVQCRSRKVRCDAKPGECGNCERLGFQCSFREFVGDELVDAVKPQRKRARRACGHCHSLKAKCSGDVPACRRCRDRGMQCHYLPSRRTKRSSPPAISHSNGVGSLHTGMSQNLDCIHRSKRAPSRAVQSEGALESDGVIDRQTAITAFENFFRYLHPLPAFSFLHKASILQKYNAGQADEALILSIIGITLQMLDTSPESREFGRKCINKAEVSIFQDREHPSVSKLQALVLVMKHRTSSRKFASAFMLMADVARMAFALRLNFENPNLCFLAQEARRRLMWSIYVSDSAWTGGLPEFTSCPAEAIHIQLPCDEEDFELDRACVTEPLKPTSIISDSPSLSLLAYHLRIMNLRDRILRFAKHTVSTGEGLSTVPTRIREFERELQEFQARLPARMRFSEKNLRLRAYSPVLPRYLMIHIQWHQCYCDLHKFLMKGLRESLSSLQISRMELDFVNDCRATCFDHAKSISGIYSMLLGLEVDLPFFDDDIGVCTYHCVRILFHTFHTDAPRFGLSLQMVLEDAACCQTFLEKLPRLSARLKSIKHDVEELIARGTSSSPFNTRANSPESRIPLHNGISPSSNNPSQILSRHSLVGGAGFSYDSSELDMPAAAIPTPQSLSSRSDLQEATSMPSLIPESESSISEKVNQDSPIKLTSHGVNGGETNQQHNEDWDWNSAYQEDWDEMSFLDPVTRMQTEWMGLELLQTDNWPAYSNGTT